jgi:predicted amidohydrolase YtcJ
MRFLLHFAVVCLTIGAASGQPAPPDEIFFNGKVVTVDASFSVHEAFAVRGDTFVAVGRNADVKALAGPRTRLTDLAGRTVIPGLMDNHTHLYHAALDEFRGVPMADVASLAEMLDRLRAALARAKPGETVVTTGGWTPARFPEKRGPTREDLDRISMDRPIVALRGRGGAVMNSAAMKAAGITRDTDTLGGNPIEKDSRGEPTGSFSGPSTVSAAVDPILPPPPVAEIAQMLRKAQGQLSEWGFTSVREIDLPPEGMRAYQELARDGTLALRVSMGLAVNAVDADRLDAILGPWGVGPAFGDKWLRLDSIGEFGLDVSGNTYYREPYADRPGERGAMRISPASLREAMLKVNRYGWRPSIHAMGDATLDNVLDAYEAANAETPIRDRRWIVEHIPIAHADQMDRMARIGVLISAQIQPYGGAPGMIRSLGQARAERAVPMREWLDHRLMVSTGSDWAGGRDNNPFENVYFYVTRRTREGTVLGANQKITRAEALRVATVNNAYMTFEEELKGSIERGKLADFVILSADILTVPDEEILKIRPVATYVGGRRVFEGAH